MERDSLVARLTEYAGALDKYARSGRVKCWPGDNIFEDAATYMRESAAALSRPEQVVTRTDALRGSYLAASCLTTAAPLQADASAPASPAIGVQAVTDEMVERACQAYFRSSWTGLALSVQFSCRAEMRAALEAALHPAPEAASEGAAGETLAQAEARVMQEYRWGNLTPLGVANHLRRAGFRSQAAVEKANALSPSDTAPSPKGVSDGVRELVAEWRRRVKAIGRDVGRYRFCADELEAALSQEPVPATAEERAASKEGA